MVKQYAEAHTFTGWMRRLDEVKKQNNPFRIMLLENTHWIYKTEGVFEPIIYVDECGRRTDQYGRPINAIKPFRTFYVCDLCNKESTECSCFSGPVETVQEFVARMGGKNG